MRLVVDEARDFAIFFIDLSGRIERWNQGAQRIFGWCEDEVIGRHFSVLATPEDIAAGAPEAELATARETGRAEDTRWHMRKDGSRLYADGITMFVNEGDGAVVGFAKICRDVTGRYLSERRLAAQLALSNLLTADAPIDEVERRMMQTICESLQWDIGAMWHVDERRQVLRPAQVWAAPGVPQNAFEIVAATQEMAMGVGLPGQVWQIGRPLWVSEFTEENGFPRASLAALAGMQRAFAFPITHGGRVLGVMEFFSRERRDPDAALLPILSLIGSQVGDYIERRRTAEALAASELRFRTITETAQDAIFTIDANSIVLFANRAVERVFGYAPEELIGKPLEVIIPERLREAHRAGIARYIRTRRRHIPWQGMELTGFHRDGHEFPLELSFGAFEIDGELRFSGFARDMTERHRTAESLREALAHEQQARAQIERRAEEEVSFRRLASALTGAAEMHDVLHEITSRATLVTRADGVYVERIVKPKHEVEVVAEFGRGTPARGLRVAYPGSLTEEILSRREPVILTYMGAMGASMAPYLAEGCGVCEVLVTPLVAEDEALGALVLLNSTVSGRTFKEGDVIRARTLGDLTSLALRRVRLMEEEREAKEKAEAAVRVRDETLGIVSHDLRNPLTTIALAAELLPDSTGEEAAEQIATIRSAAKQMQRLIQDLLDVARVESGRLSVRKMPVDATALARLACSAQEQLAASKKLELVCAIGNDLPQVEADRDRVLQVFANLIGNAIKFTPAGGTITLSAEAREGMVLFSVRDTGPGIPDGDLENVFRPYWQAKTTAHMGAGLGLAIVRGIVEAHGGSVHAANGPGGGAVFTFTIPA